MFNNKLVLLFKNRSHKQFPNLSYLCSCNNKTMIMNQTNASGRYFYVWSYSSSKTGCSSKFEPPGIFSILLCTVGFAWRKLHLQIASWQIDLSVGKFFSAFIFSGFSYNFLIKLVWITDYVVSAENEYIFLMILPWKKKKRM